MLNRIGDTVAFVPLRGGSKSIPLKNIKSINGRPLVYWVLDAAIGCSQIDKIVVSTDSDEIREVVSKFQSEKILLLDRSEEVSSDKAKSEEVMLEFACNYDFKTIILVQATSPLLKTSDLIKGLEKFSQTGIDSVLSAVRQKRFIWSENHLQTYLPVNYNPLNRPIRQEFNGFLVENGAFYITSRKKLLESKCRISGNIEIVEMPDNTYIELDEPEDWVVVEQLMKHSNINNDILINKAKKIKCLLTDCDGVLTDGGMYYSENRDELKKFNTKDGMGFKICQENKIVTGIISGENLKLIANRSEKMNANVVYLGILDKIKALDEICAKFALTYEEVAYIGDDINDFDVVNAVGLGCTVRNGMKQLKEIADYVTQVNGGEGAVREVVELILNAKRSTKDIK